MILNNTIKELYSINSKIITNDHIVNIINNDDLYKTGEQYINIADNPSFIKNENDILWDITLGIPFLDNSVNFIYCGDVFDNLNYDEQTYFLQEVFRTLRNDGVFRLSFKSLKFEGYNDIEFNKIANTIPERPFINNNDDLISRIQSLGLNLSSELKLKEQKRFGQLFNKKNINDYENAIIEPVETDLIIFDDQYPPQKSFGWRSQEFEYYNSCNFKTTIMSLNGDRNFFNENLQSYRKYHQNTDIILYNPHRIINAKLAYLLFLNNTYIFLPIIERNNLPFVFTLYPGGGFSLDNKESDNKLRKIFASPLFKKVIVTQEITKRHLLDNNFCTEDKIKYIYGGVRSIGTKEHNSPNNIYNLQNKNQFNICFCAFKYTDKGIDKGYDIFIDVAKILSKIYKDMSFHVIGNFDKNDIECDDVKNIHFYGPLYGEVYTNTILEMNIVLTCPRYGKILKGVFNGFPLNTDFAYAGVPIFTTDDLKCNTNYIDNEDIVILDHVPENVVKKIEFYYNNPHALEELSKNCQKKTIQLLSDEIQLGGRMQILNKYLK